MHLKSYHWMHRKSYHWMHQKSYNWMHLESYHWMHLKSYHWMHLKSYHWMHLKSYHWTHLKSYHWMHLKSKANLQKRISILAIFFKFLDVFHFFFIQRTSHFFVTLVVWNQNKLRNITLQLFSFNITGMFWQKKDPVPGNIVYNFFYKF